MNYIEQLHLKAIENSKESSYYPEYEECFSEETCASKSAQITKDIAIEFCEFFCENEEKLQHLNIYFNMFLKTKQ